MDTDKHLDKNGSPLIKVKKAFYVLGPYSISVETPEVISTDKNGIVTKSYRGSDDNTFNIYPHLAQLFPRGLSYGKITKDDIVEEHIIRGYPKFTSLNDGDEDTEIACSALINKKDIDSADTAVITEKANGKFVVMSAFMFDNTIFLFGGSKSVHRILRREHIFEDLDNIEKQNGSTLDLVKDIFIALSKQLVGAPSEGLPKLFYSNCLTGEYEDGKHLVPLRGEPIIRWFGLIPKENKNQDIIKDLELLKTADLPTITYEIVPANTVDRIKLRDGTQLEGRVIHWMKNGQTVVMEKYKCIWYIILRVLRTLILNKRKDWDHNYKAIIKSRLLERNRDFMKLSQPTLEKWFNLCVRFTEWFIREKYEVNSVNINSECKGMGVVYSEFLLANPDVDDNIINEVSEAECMFDVFTENIVVFMQGVPGLGKNTISRPVETLLREVSVNCISIDQDSFISMYGKNAGKACLKKFNEFLACKQYKVILVLRNNAEPKQYNTYVSNAMSAGWKTLILKVADPLEATLFNVCAESVLLRSGHVFDSMVKEERVRILACFFSLLINTPPPKAGREAMFVDEIYWLKDNIAVNDKVFKSYMESGHGFDIKCRPLDKTWVDSIRNSSGYRRNVEDIAKSITDLTLKYLSKK